MPKLLTRFVSSAAILLFATSPFLSSGCSSSKPITPAVVLVHEGYTEALKLYNNKEYQAAALNLESLIFTSRATALEDDVLYLLAQSYYHSKQYLLAADMFSRLLQQMPSSPYARTSQFMLAKSYEQLSPPVELDQQHTLKAIDNFAAYLELYPMTDSAKIAQDVETYRELLKINPTNTSYQQSYSTATQQFARVDSLRYSNKAIVALREKLAKSVLVVARQYVQLGKYQAAGLFYDKLITNYGDTSSVKDAFEEKITVLIKREKWFDAANTLDTYLQFFPERQKEMQRVKENIAQHIK